MGVDEEERSHFDTALRKTQTNRADTCIYIGGPIYIGDPKAPRQEVFIRFSIRFFMTSSFLKEKIKNEQRKTTRNDPYRERQHGTAHNPQDVQVDDVGFVCNTD